MRNRPNLSSGDVDVGGEEGERNGGQQEVVVKIVLGMGHLNFGPEMNKRKIP